MTDPKQYPAIGEQPVSSVEWVNRNELNPNDYNPNHVAPPELTLLMTSILEDGWTQPIVRNPDGSIVDGYHRWLISGQKEMMERFGPFVPCVTVELDEVHRKMSTIRHNRARGKHAVLRMSEIIANMLEAGVAPDEICQRLQMEDEEVERLADRGGMPNRIRRLAEDDGFGCGWVAGTKEEAEAVKRDGLV